MEICEADYKSLLKKQLAMKLEKLLAFMYLKIYDLSSIKEIKLNIKKYENIYKSKFNHFISFAMDVQRIKHLKIGEKFLLILEEGHQDAEFIKLSSEEISEKIKNIPTECIRTYGLCGDYIRTYKCFACENQGHLTEFWHSNSKSIFFLVYICENCQCKVYYSYDWSGPWD